MIFLFLLLIVFIISYLNTSLTFLFSILLIICNHFQLVFLVFLLQLLLFLSYQSMLLTRKKLANSFSKTFRQILFFVVPATALLIILRAQIVRIVYGAGNFDWNDTILTMNTLAFFSISLFAQATIPLLVRVFYARHNSKLPFYLGLITVAANVVFIHISF